SVHVSHSSVAVPRRPHQDNGEGGGICHRVVCVERMSPVEIELYFEVVAQWLLQKHEGEARPLLIRLVGTYDTGVPPTLDEQVGRLVALVHLERAGARDVRRQRPVEGLRENSLVTGL
ncbi:MAG: hypothetical protein M8467_08580, partial [Anaerolineae bacterium]|nr:hypothetical protein [Anaerolineae bacterium]